jgi:hypothetical protein
VEAHVPIQHTVVFRLIHESNSAEESEFLDTATRILAAIEGVEAFAVDRQISSTSDLRWRFSMLFRNQSAYDAYNNNPAHVRFVNERWLTEVAAFQELDFIART